MDVRKRRTPRLWWVALTLVLCWASMGPVEAQPPSPDGGQPGVPEPIPAGAPPAPPEGPVIPPGAPEANPSGAPGAAMPGAPAEAPPGAETPGGMGAPTPGRRSAASDIAPPGSPGRSGRPRPGSIFDPGAAGPGISRSGTDTFLDGALDPRTGWPFVFLNHFAPRPNRVARFWVVQTRRCPQVLGTEPWPCLDVLHFDPEGRMVERPPAELFAQSVGRPVLIVVQGSLTTPDAAVGGLMWVHSWLERHRALYPNAVVIAFDWPSQRVYRNDFRDINEKGRRAYVAGYHLARFVQGFPPGGRICLLGQSFGGRVVPTALHFLGGGAMAASSQEAPVAAPGLRPDLHIRAVIIAAATDRDWLDPCQKLDHALLGCEGFLNLYNTGDEALLLYPLLIRSGHRRALGRVGLSDRDLERLGPLAARYEEEDVDDDLGDEHTLLDAVANPDICRRIAPYVWSPDPGPSPPRHENGGAATPRVERRERRGQR